MPQQSASKALRPKLFLPRPWRLWGAFVLAAGCASGQSVADLLSRAYGKKWGWSKMPTSP